MPKPLILLERHDSSGAKRFVIDNVENFKENGYTKFLLEMNSEISPAQLKKQLSQILSVPGVAQQYPAYQALYNMLLVLEKNQIPYEFIDPETQAEATALNSAIQVAYESGNEDRAMAERQQKTDLRDVKMSAKIIADSELCSGGVIFLGGWAHTHLVRLLELNREDFYRYAMFIDSGSDVLEAKILPKEQAILSQMPNSEYRAEFYKAKVKYFDLAAKPSYEMIEAECKLTVLKPIDKPVVGGYLEKATKQAYSFVMDEHHVVTATAVINDEKKLKDTTDCLKRDFPGLRFFVEKKEAVVTIPGLNLPENKDSLKNGFVKLGIMKS